MFKRLSSPSFSNNNALRLLACMLYQLAPAPYAKSFIFLTIKANRFKYLGLLPSHVGIHFYRGDAFQARAESDQN
ncbi:hypothetical protein SPSP110954_12225 [Sporolactobacillus spathodeae]